MVFHPFLVEKRWIHANFAHATQSCGITKMEVAEIIPSFFVIMKHTSASCSLLKVEAAEKLIELFGKREEAAKKHD